MRKLVAALGPAMLLVSGCAGLPGQWPGAGRSPVVAPVVEANVPASSPIHSDPKSHEHKHPLLTTDSKEQDVYTLPVKLGLSRPKPKGSAAAKPADAAEKPAAIVLDDPAPPKPIASAASSAVDAPRLPTFVAASPTTNAKESSPSVQAPVDPPAKADAEPQILAQLRPSTPASTRDVKTTTPSKVDPMPIPPPPIATEPTPASLKSAEEFDQELAAAPGSQRPSTSDGPDVKATNFNKEPREVLALKPVEQPTRPSVDAPHRVHDSFARTPTKLEIDRLQFAKEISGFGMVEPAPADSLRGGAQVLLYTEVRNFVSKEVDGKFETNLASLISIESPDGAVVAPIEFKDVVDRCQTRRTDFFCHYTFLLPEKLPAGRYVLRLTLKDLYGGETTEKSFELNLLEANREGDGRVASH